jgi:nicotinate-nucleotide--dimethylbenzimidazole phosphoribosyltransferase
MMAGVEPLDEAAARAAAALEDRLTKPPGSLGVLEGVGVRLSAIAGRCPPPVPEPAAVAVFAGDHGVLAQGVSPWPQEVTAQMVANFVAGGAAVNVLARQVGAVVEVIDVGVAADLRAAPGLRTAKVRRGTADLSVEPAMGIDEAWASLELGCDVAADLVARGAGVLLTGDMGIGNTTASAALISAFTGAPAALVTGRGTGVDDEQLAHKVTVVDKALSRTGDLERHGEAAVAVLASLGGLEIAALAGFLIGGAQRRVPVLLDGVVADAAALVAVALQERCRDYLFAGHRSVEPGAAVALDHLGLEPLIDLRLRLGEGTGACLALPVLQAAARVLGEMATFDSAGVTERTDVEGP